MHLRYDAGDFLKLNFPLSTSVTLLAWSVLDFGAGHAEAGALAAAVNNVQLAATYLMECHIGNYQYVGQIGDPGSDHSYWGRPEQQPGPRPFYVWTKSTPASDLLGGVAAALTSTSLVLKSRDATLSAKMLGHAKMLYAWGKAVPGKYSDSYTSATYVYTSSRYLDKLMYAAAWLYRATGNPTYAVDAYKFWQQAGSGDIYTGWDSTYAPAINLLLKLAAAGKAVPGKTEYESWWVNTFESSWHNADGNWSIVKTPKGLVYPSWNQWGNLRFSCNAAFMMLARASYASSNRAANIQWARGQLNYMLTSTGRSFVVGLGSNYPRQPHHRSASCPNQPATCDWAQFSSTSPNPQILYGALVGGPTSGDGTYKDQRSDYVTNKVAVDYNAGYTAALAALLALS